MPQDVEGLAKVQGLIGGVNEGLNSQLRLKAAQDAASMFKAGDIKGALSTMAAVDPDHVANLIQTFQQTDPNSQGALQKAQTGGQLAAQTELGINAGQIQDKALASAEKIAQMKANTKAAVIRKSDRSPSGFSTFSGGKEIFIDPAGNPIGQAPDAVVINQSAKPNLALGQDVNSEGKIITLSPFQQKAIKETRKTFDAETKDLVKGIEAGHQALEMIDKNVPGSEALEKIRVLRSVAQSRINTQEFQQYGKDMGLFNQAENQLSKASGKGMSPQVQSFMRAVAQTAMDTSTKEYEQKLTNTIERTQEVDPLILKKRLIGSGPTIYQALVKKVEALDPQLQAVYNQAHDAAMSTDPKTAAKGHQALKIFSDKYGIKP